MNFLEKYNTFLKENNLDSLDISHIVPKSKLHPKFWSELVLHEAIQKKLMDISLKIMDNIKISDFIEDIVITGSMASYNWHSLSDIDLHFIFDFRKIDDNVELVKKMLDLTRMKWNKDHKITIFNHEVELYFQDSNEEHESMGMYSLLKREWIQNPVVSAKKPDKYSVGVKAESIVREIDRIQEIFVEKKFKEAYLYAISLKKKIRHMRTAGLTRDGVFSVENLTFKVLRNNDKLSLLSFLKNMSYDKMMSITRLVNVKVE